MSDHKSLKNVKDIHSRYPDEFISPGNAGCPGCGAVLAIRLAMKVLGRNTWGVLTTGCMAVNYTAPNTGVALTPWIHPLFGNAAAIASGLDIALELRSLRDTINILVVGGDGGTADIGFQAISAAFQRNQNIIYLCYDNGGYQNTGGQRSGTTDYLAITKSLATRILPKNLPMIFREHKIPYIATASIAYPVDFMNKINIASKIQGSSYIQVLTPCVPSWGMSSQDTIKIAKLAVTTGYQILWSQMNNKIEISEPSREYIKAESRAPIEEFLILQKRFKDVLEDENEIKLLKQQIQQNWLQINQLISQLQNN